MPCRPTSKNFSIPNDRANSRAATPEFASVSVGAGTAWSMMIAVRSGSAIFTGSGQFVNIRSISTFMSTRHTTVSPALTRSCPDARARIFSIMVMLMGILSCHWYRSSSSVHSRKPTRPNTPLGPTAFPAGRPPSPASDVAIADTTGPSSAPG